MWVMYRDLMGSINHLSSFGKDMLLFRFENQYLLTVLGTPESRKNHL